MSIVFCIFLLFAIVLVKNENAYKNQEIILDGIHEYQKYAHLNRINPIVDYDDMKSYDEVFFNLFDWGYKNILPKEKYEIIEKYIN